MTLRLLHNERMKFFILFIVLSNAAFAQKSLNAITFQANVRPVLSGILSDFHQMIALFPDFPQDLIGITYEVQNFHSEQELLKEKCPRFLEKACLTNINNIRIRLQNIQSKTLKLISSQKITPNLHMNPIGGLRMISEFQIQTEQIKGILDNSALIIKAGASERKSTYEIIKLIDELSTYLSLTVVGFVPYTYREDFGHFYFNFIYPIQQQISKNQNYEFLNKNINSLNFSINLLNQNLTKRNKKTPEGMAPYLALMHNRWNSLLRYYF
jgi:hypothetical protein